MNDFFAFRRMVTPLIIQVLFWIGVAFVVIWGLVLIFIGAPAMPRPQAVGIGLLTLVLGPLAVRIYAELLMVMFRINETLTDVYEELRNGGSRRELT